MSSPFSLGFYKRAASTRNFGSRAQTEDWKRRSVQDEFLSQLIALSDEEEEYHEGLQQLLVSCFTIIPI
jgi:hypothetical protein